MISDPNSDYDPNPQPVVAPASASGAASRGNPLSIEPPARRQSRAVGGARAVGGVSSTAEASTLAPASAGVVHWVRQRLLDGQFRLGQRLPPERQLAVELGVSRLPLREGLKWLQARGLVSIHHGRGGFIGSRPDPDVIADALLPLLLPGAPGAPGAPSDGDHRQPATVELLDTWKLLESELAGAAARRCADGGVPANLVGGISEAVEARGQAGEWTLHELVADLSGRTLLQVLHQALGRHVRHALQQSPLPVGALGANRALRSAYAEAVAAGRETDARTLAVDVIEQRCKQATQADGHNGLSPLS